MARPPTIKGTMGEPESCRSERPEFEDWLSLISREAVKPKTEVFFSKNS